MPAPPLPLLRTFESAARHASFVRAAAELNVTPAAVSQQIRSLEDRLGVKLFVRHARGLTVTSSGKDYAVSIARAMADIETATRALGRPERKGRLNVATFQSFASLWLLPRLHRFRARYPEIDVRLVISDALADLSNGEVDVAIRFGAGDYRGCQTRLLMTDTVFPACAPSLIAGMPIPRRITDLAEFPLLHDDGLSDNERSLSWSDWLGDVPLRTAQHLPNGLLTLQAALLGEGVALVRHSAVAAHLRAGQLMRLLEDERESEFSHWLVTATGESNRRAEAFAEWIVGEIEADGA
ncbi:LysR substrate-binding domain-containing protein [Sphingosinithalassobacter sp. CS137]|uniref:LysR substrate-binding domain-containing protein n=1 Tax=Sphingosinithalassobacter sp. CS137 TaxID=2762748 RepID=UPI00165EADA2|nr:LysR substrate-binding domain-containing protein [Sphingosinithalassobacter sp. CS137]